MPGSPRSALRRTAVLLGPSVLGAVIPSLVVGLITGDVLGYLGLGLVIGVLVGVFSWAVGAFVERPRRGPG